MAPRRESPLCKGKAFCKFCGVFYFSFTQKDAKASHFHIFQPQLFIRKPDCIDAPVAYWQITEFTSSETIEEVFQAARRLAPAVLVIEDIDSMPEDVRSFFLRFQEVHITECRACKGCHMFDKTIYHYEKTDQLICISLFSIADS